MYLLIKKKIWKTVIHFYGRKKFKFVLVLFVYASVVNGIPLISFFGDRVLKNQSSKKSYKLSPTGLLLPKSFHLFSQHFPPSFPSPADAPRPPTIIVMDYDFRNRTGPPYEAQIPMYRQQPTSSSSSSSMPSSHPMYGPSLYPRIGQPAHTVVPPAPRIPSFHHTSSPSSSCEFSFSLKVLSVLVTFMLFFFEFGKINFFLCFN